MFGKVVINNDAGKVFVNNYGVTHQYSETSWKHRNPNCPANPIDGRGNDLSKLSQGPEWELTTLLCSRKKCTK